MMTIDELRGRLDRATAELTTDVTGERIRRRARAIRTRRHTWTAAASVVALTAVAVPATALLSNQPGNLGSPSICLVAPRTVMDTPRLLPGSVLGFRIDTGVVLDAPNLGARFDVLFGLEGDGEEPAVAVSFRNRATGGIEDWTILAALIGDGHGSFAGNRPGDPPFQFISYQLRLGPHDVLDMGLYSTAAARITVASEGHTVDAQTGPAPVHGWTFFWARRSATPLPRGLNGTAVPYAGPEVLTITAYDDNGLVQHTVTGGYNVGLYAQNPRDDSPDASPSAGTSAPPPVVAMPTSQPTCTPS